MEECKTWVTIIRYGDVNSHTEQITSFGIFPNEFEGREWANEAYKNENVIVEVIPFNDPFPPAKPDLTIVQSNDKIEENNE